MVIVVVVLVTINYVVSTSLRNYAYIDLEYMWIMVPVWFL